MSLDTLHDLLVYELRDLHDAEQQLLDALPLLAQEAQNPQLRKLFEQHLVETRGQLQRLARLFSALGTTPAGKPCQGMRGLVAETRETIQEKADPRVLDAALIVAAQKIEHYEIAGYGSARTFARRLGYTEAARILDQTLGEETAMDEKLSRAAEIRVNTGAAAASSV